jgi:hypothetical protein
MRQFMAVAAICALGLGNVAEADQQPVVIELYTSQGCSSCPPADQLLGELAQRDNVIALALHVDYWDYIGWKDSFGSPAHTKRQKHYAKAAGERTIYTPQLIVGGKEHVVGYRPMELAELIQAHLAAPDTVRMTAVRKGGMLAIQAERVSGAAVRMVVQLVRYSPKEVVTIERGENAGNTFTYHNVVRDWSTVGEWDGAAPLSLELAAPEGAAAVIIQQAGFGPVMAAARLD